MINGFEINGAVINGEGGTEAVYSIAESLGITESVKTSMNFGRILNEALSISETINTYLVRGAPQAEGVSISENLNIIKGVNPYASEAEALAITETVTATLNKGALLETQLNYYISLLIMQYRNKPNAEGTLRALVTAALIDGLPSILQNAFNLDTAVGVQLDWLGKYIGLNRRVKTFTTGVTLSDSDYRTMLKIKRAANSIDASLYAIDTFVYNNLNGVLYVFDHNDMTMSFYLNSDVISNTLGQAIIEMGILPKPAGVAYSSIVYLPDFSKIFGFRDYFFNTGAPVGFNSYTSYDSSKIFLKYEDTIT